MTIEEAITSHLKAQSAITALVGPRIYQDEREQATGLPAVCFFGIGGGTSEQDMTAGSVGVAGTPFQFDCYAATSKQAAAIREMVRLAFQNHINALMGGVSGVHVWACLYSGSHGGYDPDFRTFVRSVDFDILHEQAVS